MRTCACLLACMLAACADNAAAPTGPIDTPVLVPRPLASPDQAVAEGYFGVLTARTAADVRSQYATEIATIDVDLGTAVTVGQKLATLDERVIRDDLALAEAALQTAMATSRTAQVNRNNASRQLKLERDSFAKGVASGEQVAAAKAAVDLASAQVSGAEAAVGEQRARINALKKGLAELTLTAPIEGKVAMIYAERGARVSEGQTVVRIIANDGLILKFAVPGTDAAALKVGDPLDVRVESANLTVKAKVRTISPELDAVAQMIVGEAELIDPPATLQAGFQCRLRKAPSPASP